MKDEDKTSEQLIRELSSLRRRIHALEGGPSGTGGLAEQAARLRPMLDDLPIGFAVFSRDMTVLWINQALAAMFHTSPEQVIGREVFDVWPQAHELTHIYDSVLQGEAIDFPSLRRQYPGEERYFQLHYRPLSDNSGGVAGLLLVANDITQRKRAEDTVQERSEELARSNAELEQFAYVASHDLQEPLRMVSSFVEFLAADYKGKLDEQSDRYIDYILDGTSRMKALIDDLLRYSRVGAEMKEPVPTDCNNVVDVVVGDLKNVIKENGAKVTRGSLPVVYGDDSQFAQLFQNLVSNGIKFCGEKPPLVHVGAREEGGTLDIPSPGPWYWH